jgi:uncharacterized membrane protein
MNRMRVLILAAELSILYNVVLLFGVSLNYQWTTTRAAGGQFDSFPTGIRILYFFMAIFMSVLMFWVWGKRRGLATRGEKRIATFLTTTFVVSTVMQLVSQSSDERWNAIPALILAFTFWVLRDRRIIS